MPEVDENSLDSWELFSDSESLSSNVYEPSRLYFSKLEYR